MLYREHIQKLSKTLQDTKTTTQRQVTMNPLKIVLTGLQKTLKESWGNKTKGETMQAQGIENLPGIVRMIKLESSIN